MRIRRQQSEDKIELQMTSMIDIVFQLLVFFIMTFKIVVQEGDFNIRMPLAAQSQAESIDFNLPIKIELKSDSKGNIADIVVNDSTSFDSFDKLNAYIRQTVGSVGPEGFDEETEVEFDCDYQLRYEETVKAITAVSGYKNEDGEIIKLIKKIKFKDQAG